MGYMARIRKAVTMSNGNGHKPPIAFPGAADVPILGQPFALEAWFIQILLTCKCAHPKPFLIVGQPGTAVGQCASCQQLYQLQAIGINPITGQPHFQIAMIVAPKADGTPPADLVP
jgi:hypothetical protein